MVRMLAKPIALACPAPASSKALVGRRLWLHIGCKYSTPSPLPGQLTKFTLVQVLQHLNIWDAVQPVLDSLQMSHLVTTIHYTTFLVFKRFFSAIDIFVVIVVSAVVCAAPIVEASV